MIRAEKEPKPRKCTSCGTVGETILLTIGEQGVEPARVRLCVAQCVHRAPDTIVKAIIGAPGDAHTSYP